MKVLIHNSDSPLNRGDRAILVGNIELVRQEWPDAEIWSLSQFPERDAEWFGIHFLDQSPYSVNPLHWWKLFRFARSADLVLWGGGEILKDYTNKLGLIYWAIKIWLLSLANRRLLGAFQGIGPTSASISKRLITFTVNRTRVFLVRDHESRTKLEAWGVTTPVVASFDPAVVGRVSATSAAELAAQVPGVADAAFLDNVVGFGLRKWFHYRQGGWLPARFRPGASKVQADSAELELYRERMAELADSVVETYDANILFFPMHLGEGEGDDAFAHSVIALMRHPERARVAETDAISPDDYVALIARCRFFIASRLHSAILATVARVPTIVFYYVDKGRLFFEQLGLEQHSRPIASTLEDGAIAEYERMIAELDGAATAVVAHADAKLAEMVAHLRDDFRTGAAQVRGAGERATR